MSALARALLDELDDEALDALADRLAHRLRPAAPAPDGWLDAKRAAAFLGITANALHKLTAARVIPFEQEGPGCKLWFRRSELDGWRRGACQAGALPRADASKSLPDALIPVDRARM